MDLMDCKRLDAGLLPFAATLSWRESEVAMVKIPAHPSNKVYASIFCYNLWTSPPACGSSREFDDGQCSLQRGLVACASDEDKVDAFTAEPFKGNPAAVCFLDDDASSPAGDERWMQSVAVEFNLSQTAFLSRDSSCPLDAATPRFHLRWFTSVTEVALCGHATLASAHFLFTSVLADHHGVVEFATKSGILTAKKVPAPETEEQRKLFVELDFPMLDFVGSADELPSIPDTLNGASVVSVHKAVTTDDFIVELSSGKEVADVLPNTEEIRKCSGRGLIITGPAPAGSGYDFFSRFFCPKFGVNEDPVCGSAHCVLAPYWAGKLGKQKLIAFQVSPRSGVLYLELDVASGRVRLQGEAVTVMAGTLFA